MSKLASIKSIIMEKLGDGQEHSAKDLRDEIRKCGIDLPERSSAFRTAVYQLKNSGINIESRERGLYCLVKSEAGIQLKGFTVLKPVDKVSRRCVYIHEDGKIVLNGKLNGEISSRRVEIRIADSGEKIALIEDGKECHRFSKSGHTKNIEIIKILGKKRILFPICYEMEKQDNLWIGKLKRAKSNAK